MKLQDPGPHRLAHRKDSRHDRLAELNDTGTHTLVHRENA